MEENKKTIIALKKAHSHLGNIIRMVEDGEYCIDIIQQNLAVIGLLKSANGRVLEGHLNSCFAAAMRGTNERRKKEMIAEILAINKLSE
ncbi:MAG: metal-sensing transcriptional repressor [Candidatus Pacebacteria bacterium]|nr:metal-sensing transcriptional repressor [Candidatus Paceibacterota bacterium]MDR3583214.1 metal-sensing transcriptional repressor [Candidatus Paceibacterota bacterium]